jgi:hypothetical protein
MESMTEEMQIYEDIVNQEALMLHERYTSQMDLLEGSVLGKIRPINSYDVYNLGKQLHIFERYVKWCEANGNLNQLGTLPNVGLDVIAVAYGTSIVPVIASVQPIQERHGIVWFKNVRFGDTKGGHTADDTFVDPKSGQTTPRNYAGNKVTEVLEASTASGNTAYSGTLGTIPVQKESIRITTSVAGITTNAAVRDVSRSSSSNLGDLLGVGLSGTINYDTGAWTLDFESDPGAGETITAVYQQNYETATNLPLITQFWDSSPVKAEVWALRGTFGLLQDFEMQNRLGVVAEDELARDLVAALNAEIGGALITLIGVNSQGSAVDFDKTPTSGVGLNEHYQSFKIKLRQAEANLVKNAGRGAVNTIIADVDSCVVLASMVGFQQLTDGDTIGAHIFGTLDGKTIVRVNDTAILAANTIRLIHKGASPFEGPAVWSPYMPLVVTSTLQNLDNPLQNQRAAAVFGAIDVLVPNFITSMTISSS